MSTIGSVPPVAAYTPQAITPAQTKVTQSSTDGNGNNVTLNAVNMADLSGTQVQNVTMANEVAMDINGNNNDVTVNAINILVEGSPAQAAGGGATPVTASQNPDGTVKFSDGGDVSTFVGEKLLDAIKAASAYDKTDKNNQSSSTLPINQPTTNITA